MSGTVFLISDLSKVSCHKLKTSAQHMLYYGDVCTVYCVQLSIVYCILCKCVYCVKCVYCCLCILYIFHILLLVLPWHRVLYLRISPSVHLCIRCVTIKRFDLIDFFNTEYFNYPFEEETMLYYYERMRDIHFSVN